MPARNELWFPDQIPAGESGLKPHLRPVLDQWGLVVGGDTGYGGDEGSYLAVLNSSVPPDGNTWSGGALKVIGTVLVSGTVVADAIAAPLGNISADTLFIGGGISFIGSTATGTVPHLNVTDINGAAYPPAVGATVSKSGTEAIQIGVAAGFTAKTNAAPFLVTSGTYAIATDALMFPISVPVGMTLTGFNFYGQTQATSSTFTALLRKVTSVGVVSSPAGGSNTVTAGVQAKRTAAVTGLTLVSVAGDSYYVYVTFSNNLSATGTIYSWDYTYA